MNVSRMLIVALLASACSPDPGLDRDAARPEDGAAPAVGTAGREPTAPPPTKQPAESPARDRAAEQRDGSAAKDARAAAEGPVTREAQRAGTNVAAAILEDFSTRVDDYMKIREQAADAAPALKETEDVARIEAAQESRAANIRALRAGAKPGEIFTPEIRDAFRKLLAPEIQGEEGREVKRVLRDDAPAPGSVPLEINATYPENAPLPTVPATLLTSLPELPEGLEYRIIGKDLVLLDSDANLIVDFIRNAIR